MTIPEAAQLVLQAAVLAEGGDLFLLDMGEPVRILELARQMVRLSGLRVRDTHNPDGDIEIRCTGLRPGEKLYEELLIEASSEPTAHPLIYRAREASLPPSSSCPSLIPCRLQSLSRMLGPPWPCWPSWFLSGSAARRPGSKEGHAPQGLLCATSICVYGHRQ